MPLFSPRRQNSGLLSQSSPNFFTKSKESLAVLTRASMLRASHLLLKPVHRMKVVYANFRRFAPKIGYHNNVPWAIVKRRSIDHAQARVHILKNWCRLVPYILK